MFQNSYQNGTYFQVLDPKFSQDKLKLLFRTSNINSNWKVFDKELKTFVFETVTPNAQLYLPKEEKKDLYLIQQFLTFQIYFFPGLSWSLELTVSDLTKTKRRIMLSPTTTKTQIKPFFIKSPCHGWEEGVWNNFVVDLYSYIEAFKGQTFRSLDCIHLSGHFKLRRIYTSSSEPVDSESQLQSPQIKPVNFLPKTFYYPIDVPSVTKINRYDNTILQIASEITQPSTKNGSFIKPKTKQSSRSVIPPPPKQQQVLKEIKIQQIKTEKITINKSIDKIKIENKKKKDFLSHTNGQLISRNKQKARLSIEKNGLSQKIIESKPKTQNKANPWRNRQKQELTDSSHLEISKFQSGRKLINQQNSKGFNKKIDKVSEFNDTQNNRFYCQNGNFSEPEYVQLSQKFSTFTEGSKFRKCEIPQNHTAEKKQDDEDEIEENIEMESNSHYSNSNKKQETKQNKKDVQDMIESIYDSLDKIQKKNINKQIQELGRSSLYGFGEKLMRNFMHQIERPYSPPLGEREATQEEQSVKVPVEKDEVEVIYDPVLNCYYDHRTHTYYQLKN